MKGILLSLAIVLICMLLSALMIPLSAAEQWDNGKLVVSPNGRYLMHENGVPFFWFGDTAWTIFHRLSVSEANQYFLDRQNKGFTIVQASVLGVGRIQGITEPGHNLVNGELPFFNQDPETPNEDFFQHVDAIIDKAAEYDTYVGLLPTWGEYVCPAHHDGPKIFDETNAQIYGEWIGNRYKDKPNIIWVMGGDRDGDRCGSGDLAIWRAMANGIRSVDDNHMMTYHPAGRSGSYEWFHSDSWLDLNMIESYRNTDWIYTGIENGYDMTPSKPVVNGEPAYFNRQTPIAGVDPPPSGECTYYEPPPERNYRSQPYWTALAGGTGYTFGQVFIWVFEKSTDGNDLSTTNSCDYDVDWYDYLDTDGTIWAVYWSELFRSIDWWELVPDQSIIMTNERLGDDRKVASRSSDGDMIIVYYATREDAIIDLTKITAADEAEARWWNPADKSESIIGTVSTTAAQGFTPPSGWEDAVLLVSTQATVAAPVISPNGGSFMDSVDVAITCQTPGAEIYYTHDGSIPAMDSVHYSAPFTLTENTTVKARAFKDELESDVSSAQFSLTEYSHTPVDCDGLILLMHFDENSTEIEDSSTRNNNGSCSDETCPDWTESGRFYGAFDFNGADDFIGIAHSDDFLINEGTLSLWFNPESITSENQGLFSKDALDKGTGGHFTLNIEDIPRIRGRLQSITESSSLYHDITTEIWYHAVVTFGPSGLKMYINGSLVDQSTYTGGMGTSSGGTGNHEPASIGASTGLSDSLSLQPLAQFFDGTIDEVAVWNRSLSASEIAGLYYMNKPVFCGPFHRADDNPRDGCIEEHELIPFIDHWKYDSTTYPMWETMEAVTMWSSGTGCVS